MTTYEIRRRGPGNLIVVIEAVNPRAAISHAEREGLLPEGREAYKTIPLHAENGSSAHE